MKKYLGNKRAICLFILPAMILFTLFIFVPIIQVFVYSFSDWNGLGIPKFTGLANYKKLFSDSTFIVANKNQLIFALVITVYQMFLGTVFAIAVSNKNIKGRKFLRVAYFIPVVLSVTVVCQLWMSILNDNGLFNQLMAKLGINLHQNWLSDRYKSIYVIAFVNAWQWTGYQFALIMAGIKSIPNDYYEAATVDGANNIIAHTKITIPLLAETYKFCLVISLTGGVKAFTEMFIMTNGGPGTSTYTLTYMMYKAAFNRGQHGYGLAAATVMVLECMMLMIVINVVFKDRDVYDKKAKKGNRRLRGHEA